MKIINISPDTWGSNCYLLISDNEAFVVDPSPPVRDIMARLKPECAKLTGIVLTHGHFDHVYSADELKRVADVPVMIHGLDNEMLSNSDANCSKMFNEQRTFGQADKLLADGTVLKLGSQTIEVIHTPGHTKGSICLMSGDILLTGDTLFAEGFGRIDLPGGSHTDMKQSLRRLYELDHKLRIYPGHANASTLGEAVSTIRFLNR